MLRIVCLACLPAARLKDKPGGLVVDYLGIAAELKRNEELGLNPDEIAFYDALAERPEVSLQMGDETLKKLAAELTEKLRSSKTVDWQVRDSVRAKMRLLIKRLLRKYKYPPEGQEAAIAMVLKQTEALADAWTFKPGLTARQ